VASLMIRWDEHHWIKTGIEVVDQKARLSCVVTNHGYSDWSTQAWPSIVHDNSNDDDSSKKHLAVDCTLRLHCRGESFVVQVFNATETTKNDDEEEWEFVRIAHLHKPESSSSSTDSESRFMAGVFSCCPQDQKGGHADFTAFQIEQGSQFGHSA